MDERLMQRAPGGLRKGLATALITLGGGSVPKEPDQDLVTKIALLNYKAQLDPKTTEVPEGYATEADVPKEMLGMKPTGAKIGKGNRIIPQYGGVDQSSPIPEGYVLAGGKILKDPTYIDEKDRQKMEDDARLRLDKEEAIKESALETLKTIQDVKAGSKFFGPFGDTPSKYAPSSFLGMGNYPDRSKWEANVNKLLSGKVIDVMMAMKNASKTGATGFGQLSNKELAILQQASTALNRNLTPDDAKYYLGEMEKMYQKAIGNTATEAGGDVDTFDPASTFAAARGNQTPGLVSGMNEKNDPNDPIIRRGTDQATGRRVGLTKSGKQVFL